MKRCSNCFQTKPVDQFYVKRGYGHQSRCKLCNREVCYVWANRHKPWKIERYFQVKEI